MARVISSKPVGAWEDVCGKCHYKIEYHPGDIVEGRDPDDGDHYRYVKCPNCGATKDMTIPRFDPSDYDL